MCLGLFVECLAEVLIKGVEKDIFDGQRVEVLAVEFAKSAGGNAKKGCNCLSSSVIFTTTCSKTMCVRRKKCF
jgi:hypothetical protein